MINHSSISTYSTIEEAATNVLKLISRFIGINTLFVAKNDAQTNKIVDVINKEYTLLEKDSELPFEETLCRVAVHGGPQPLVIPRLNENTFTKDLSVTHSLGDGSFIGIPIYYENGENYGTICGLDNKPFEFTEDHLELFSTMATLLTSVLEVERTSRELQQLSAPLVPIGKGIAVIPVIGNITETRAEQVMKVALEESEKRELNYLVLDLSGIVRVDDSVAMHIDRIVRSLYLLGVKAILTGFRPDLILKVSNHNIEFKDVEIFATLAQALNSITVA